MSIISQRNRVLDRNIQINPRLRGTLKKIDAGEVNSPDISADGSTVAYNKKVGRQHDIYISREGQTSPLFQTPAHEVDPKLNNDGGKVSFDILSSETGWDVGVWDGQSRTELAKTDSREQYSDISKDGSRVVFQERDSKGAYTLKLWTGSQANEVVSERGRMSHPQVAENRLAWVEKSDIYLQDQNGVVKNLTSDRAIQSNLDISDDGSKIVYTQNDRTGLDLYLRDLSQNKTTRLTESRHGERDTDLSANGEHLVWLDGERNNWKIMMRSDGENIEVARSATGMPSEPAISDDGKSIVFQWTKRGETKNRAIYRFDIDD